ncbi:MAG: hypothetical protein QOE75_780 [Solirubrobacterales bacterium]|jgi:hypothetical protein|nr:hypothetical protein [Solirubrobacterales bacterium]
MLALGRGFGVIAVVVLALLVPAAASAAAPANDNFADREVLGGPLPIEVTRSNDEATNEPEESLNLFAAAGHSVWFEWEATSTGWVTIGACEGDDEFMRLLGVYTGTAVNGLTKVADGNAKEGPFCRYSQRQYTFMAESGTKYEIAVEGNIFNPNPGFTPDTEGTFKLRIEQTPVPPNDDFADAKVLAGEIFEEPDGHRGFWADVHGYNWLATKELDEPDHEGDPGGASVWYSWTAPESGTARIGTCCAGPDLMSVYQGTALTALSEIDEVGSPVFGYPVQAGVTYKIAVDGAADEGTGEPQLGSFGLQIFVELAWGPGYDDEEEAPTGNPPTVIPPAADTSPPQTTIRKRLVKPRKGKAEFRFASSEAGGSFRCRLDDKPPRTCKSPVRFANLGFGKHVFRVFAVDAAGNADPTPALARFRILESANG